MATAPPSITQLPPAPNRNDAPADFSAKADTFVAALPPMVTQENALANWMYATSQEISGYATSAGTSATNAQTYATQASNYANAAAQSATDATNNGAAQVQLAKNQVTAAQQARDSAQTAAAAAQSAAGLPSLVGNSGKALVVTSDESGVTWGLAQANYNNVALTGTPTAPTAAVGTNTTQVATTAFVLANPGAATSSKFMQVQDQKTKNTAGGTPVTGTYTARTLNTMVLNEIPNASLASGNTSIILPAGTYYADCSSLFYLSNNTRIRLFNTTDSVELVLGGSDVIGAAAANARACLNGKFTLTGAKIISVQYICTSAQTNGLGLPSNLGTIEIYTDLKIWKTA